MSNICEVCSSSVTAKKMHRYAELVYKRLTARYGPFALSKEQVKEHRLCGDVSDVQAPAVRSMVRRSMPR